MTYRTRHFRSDARRLSEVRGRSSLKNAVNYWCDGYKYRGMEGICEELNAKTRAFNVVMQ